MRKLPLLALMTFLAISCQHAESGAAADRMNKEAYEEYEQAEARQVSDQQESPTPKLTERKIIKNADLNIQVKDVEKSTKKVESLVADHSGYINSMNLTNSSYQISNTITIKVPAAGFEALLDAVNAEGIFTNQRKIYSQDVTEEFIDIETRLQTKKDVRDRYVELLRNKAKTVEDVLQAEEAIRGLQEEIEAKEGRLKFLRERVALSTINLVIYQEVEYRPEPDIYKKSFGQRIVAGFGNGWDLILGILIGLANIWPILLIVGLLIWQRRRIFSFRRRQN